MVTIFDLSKVFEIVDHNLLFETRLTLGFNDKHILDFPPTSWAVTSHSHFRLFLIGSYDSGKHSSIGKLMISKGLNYRLCVDFCSSPISISVQIFHLTFKPYIYL